MQAGILDIAARLVTPGGLLAYATCSMLAVENAVQIEAFLARHPGWSLEQQRQFLPGDGGDGFFSAQLRRPA